VLSGCGVYDGTELHEASAVLVHLSRGGAEVQIFAPNVPQMHVIDHTKGQPSESETRNVLAESARIARGKITDLAQLSAANHDAAIFPGGFGAAKNLNVLAESARIARGKITDLAQLSAANHDAAIFPGGFGAAKNLSTFAVDGKDCKVNKDVERVLKDFHKAGKPIGLCCIAPVLAAKVLPGVEVTVGHEQEEAHVDQKNKVVTTPAFMCETALHHIHDGIGAMVTKVLELARNVSLTSVHEAHVDQKNKVVTTPAFMCETALHHIHDGIGAMVTKVLELAKK
ncbi:ES1 protein like protein, mitochondrial, partial [Myotis davidii]